MRKRYSRSYTVLSFLTMFSYRELPFADSLFFCYHTPRSSTDGISGRTISAQRSSCALSGA